MNRRRHRRFGRAWSVTDIVLAAACILTVLVGLLAAQTPPMPPGSETVDIKLKWDAPPAFDVFTAVDENDLPVPLVYRVYHSTNVPSTNWLTVATTTNHTGGVTISNLSAFTPHFFYVTVSNHFFESDPSLTIGLPAPKGKIEGTRIVLP